MSYVSVIEMDAETNRIEDVLLQTNSVISATVGDSEDPIVQPKLVYVYCPEIKKKQMN